jgi:hypothetical protein
LFGHSDSCISDNEGVGGFFWDDFYLEAGLILNYFRVSQGFISDLIEGIGSVGDELSKEDLFVSVEGVDDESHQLLDISVESKMFGWLSLGHLVFINPT